MASDSDPDGKQEVIRHKTLAESNFRSSNLKSALKHARKAHNLSPNTEGLSSMVTAFEILDSAVVSGAVDPPDWYKILQVEPFSHMNTIKQRYRKLALVLHPDKNPHVGCEEAFKLVNEGFRVFSDRTRRNEYDMKLKIRIQEERINSAVDDDETAMFWTACSGCRLLHQFERKYMGHNLMCPNCKNSFEANEVEKENEDRIADEKGADPRNISSKIITYSRRKMASRCSRGGGAGGGCDGSGGQLKRMSTEEEDEAMTLAQMQSKIKRKKAKVKGKINEKHIGREENGGRDKEEEPSSDTSVSESPKVLQERNNDEENDKHKTSRRKKKNMKGLSEVVDSEDISLGDRKRTRGTRSQEEDMEMEIMIEEDSGFYDFDKDRMQKSFKKGQVWAMYNESNDQMPRLYALIGDVISLNPFKVFISWLKSENDGNEKLISWRNIRSHISCGRFRVFRRALINRRSMFSHVVDCERAARDVYRIYPKKGSVWAVSVGPNSSFERRKSRGYDIAVCLTLYSEIHGLSIAYLQKVDGYKKVFKRREFGFHAIRWLKKDDVERMLSHQIPAKKLPEGQYPDNLEECWVLDLASVPTDLVTTA